MVDKLKECPFCGGEAIVTAQHFNGKLMTWVQCQNRKCGASTHVDTWNTRHNTTEVNELQSRINNLRLTALHWIDAYPETNTGLYGAIELVKKHNRWFEMFAAKYILELADIIEALTTNGTKHE
jgi:transcription elongation factor Elf1